jgi:hypothetical protein
MSKAYVDKHIRNLVFHIALLVIATITATNIYIYIFFIYYTAPPSLNAILKRYIDIVYITYIASCYFSQVSVGKERCECYQLIYCLLLKTEKKYCLIKHTACRNNRICSAPCVFCKILQRIETV